MTTVLRFATILDSVDSPACPTLRERLRAITDALRTLCGRFADACGRFANTTQRPRVASWTPGPQLQSGNPSATHSGKIDNLLWEWVGVGNVGKIYGYIRIMDAALHRCCSMFGLRHVPQKHRWLLQRLPETDTRFSESIENFFATRPGSYHAPIALKP